MNTQFTFTSKQKTATMVAMAIGILCLVISFFTDPEYGHARFWTNLLHNSVFFLGIAFITQFLYSASTVAFGGWFVAFKRIWEAMFSYIPYGGLFILIIIGGMLTHSHHLYHWAEPGITDHDAVLKHKSGLLNPTVFTIALITIIYGMWSFIGAKIRANSVEEDVVGGLAPYEKLKFWTASFLPVGGFSSAFVIWFLLMSIDPHWYSTMFAWYSTASFLVSAVAFTILFIHYLKSLGYMDYFTESHLHDLGKYMFGFSVFWTYLWFSQFMLIWYANNGEETVYFKTRFDHFAPLFYMNLVMNFLLPFLILMRNTSKKRVGITGFVAILVIFGHWVDFFQMIKPGVFMEMRHAAHKAGEHGGEAAHGAEGLMAGFQYPGLLELGTFVGFIGLFVFIVFSALQKASLLPKNDPFLEESFNYHS